MGITQIPTYNQILNFFLLLLLAAFSEIAATFLVIGESKMAYEVGTAVSLAAVPFYGPFAAVVIVTASSITFWMFNNRGKPFSQRNWKKLSFNVGMHAVAVFAAGNIFVSISSASTFTFLRNSLAWFTAAVIYDQINLWLLIVMLWLLCGQDFRPFHFWRENRWAMVVNISVLAVGGALLSYALAKFGSIGIVIFFLPILLSSFSFQLYVRKMKAHLNNLEEIIAERTNELSDLIEEKDAFLAVLTHDMKTPLTSIGLYADMLIKHPEIAGSKPKMLATIKRSQVNLTEIVNNILDVEKLKAGNDMTLDKVPIDLVPVIEFLMDDIAAQAGIKNINLHLLMESESIIVNADERQIKRVLQNLISNAIKYTPRGGKVWTNACIKNGYVIIDIKDNGFGIPADELPLVFDRYHRVQKHENVAVGTGLGLAITKAIIEAHGGEITVISEEEKGSTFTVRLPL